MSIRLPIPSGAPGRRETERAHGTSCTLGPNCTGRAGSLVSTDAAQGRDPRSSRCRRPAPICSGTSLMAGCAACHRNLYSCQYQNRVRYSGQHSQPPSTDMVPGNGRPPSLKTAYPEAVSPGALVPKLDRITNAISAIVPSSKNPAGYRIRLTRCRRAG